MWTCKQCGEEIEDEFDACWSCSAFRTPTAELSVTADAEIVADSERSAHDPAGPSAKVDVLDSARQCDVHRIGLFRRVHTTGCLTHLIGLVAGLLLSVGILLIASLILAALGLTGGIGITGLLVVAGCIGAGEMWAARLLRKAKEVPDDFALVMAGADIHVHAWSFDGTVVRLGPHAASWSRRSVSVAVGNIEMRPAGVPAAAATATTISGVGFLLDGEPMFQAEVLSVVDADEETGVIVMRSAEHNAALGRLRKHREQATEQ